MICYSTHPPKHHTEDSTCIFHADFVSSPILVSLPSIHKAVATHPTRRKNVLMHLVKLSASQEKVNQSMWLSVEQFAVSKGGTHEIPI